MKTQTKANLAESDPCESESYQQFVESMAKHCHCEPPYQNPCDGVLAGGLCDGMKPTPKTDEDYDNED